MDFTGTARAIVGGLKSFATGDLRETMETIDRGLTTVDHGLRVTNGVLDTIERSVGIGRQVFSGLCEAAAARTPLPPDAAAAGGQSPPDRPQTAAERGDALLRQAREDRIYNEMLAHHAAMTRRTAAFVEMSRDAMDPMRGNSSRSSRRF